MKSEQPVLIVGDHNAHINTMAERVRDLGHSTVRMKSLDEAINLALERHINFAVAILEVPSVAFHLRQALESFKDQTNSFDMRCIATGTSPSDADRSALREAGVSLALWSPFEDTALRFQLNSALAPSQIELLRSELRAPFDIPATVCAGSRIKRATLYSLSAAGAYFETPRPSMPGAQIKVAFPLPGGKVSAACQVLYTNVPGNLSKGLLPMGMAVRFSGLGREVGDAIRNSVECRSAELSV